MGCSVTIVRVAPIGAPPKARFGHLTQRMSFRDSP